MMPFSLCVLFPGRRMFCSATAAISAYGRVGRWEDAVDLLETLLEEQDRKSEVLYHTFVPHKQLYVDYLDAG